MTINREDLEYVSGLVHELRDELNRIPEQVGGGCGTSRLRLIVKDLDSVFDLLFLEDQEGVVIKEE